MANGTEGWSGGYVTDLEYTHGFYRELEPGYLSYAALFSGHLPPDIDEKFTYCELGCGNGLSTNIIASAWPDGDFYGIDFNPSHVGNAATLSKNAKLKNVEFMEADFRELGEYDLPKFDFIVIHGVLSWINDENRKAIQTFVLKKLKPGGILYISYNCLPGMAAAMPVRELMKRFADDTYGSTMEKVNGSISSLEKAFQTKLGFFNSNPSAQAKLSQIKTADKNYIAHEYFNRDWKAFYHNELAVEFENSKVSFIGSADLFDSYLDLYANKDGQKLIQESKNTMMKETLKDYYLNRTFRKDLFMRGTKRLSPKEQLEKMNVMLFSLCTPEENIKFKMKLSNVDVSGKEELYKPVVAALTKQPTSMPELCQLPAARTMPPSIIVQTVTILIASGQASPAAVKSKNKKTAARMNMAILERSSYSNKISHMVSPVLRTGVVVDWFSQLFIKAALENKEPIEYAWQILQSLNQRMIRDEKAIEEPEENLKEIRLRFKLFQDQNMPFFKRLGIIE